LQKRLASVRRRYGGAELQALYNEMLDGNTVFLVDGLAGFLSVASCGSEARARDGATSQSISKARRTRLRRTSTRICF
jgi:hypothetical protein